MRWAGFLLIAGALLGSSANALQLDSLHQDAPDLSLQDSEGHSKHLKEFLTKPLVLHVWATWCSSCQKELPDLAAQAETWKSEGISFLAISVDPPAKKKAVASFVKKFSPSVTPWVAADPKEAEPFWAWGLPTTYLIDSKGKMVGRVLGAQNWHEVTPKELKHYFQRN
jgi:peroxiredoxin